MLRNLTSILFLTLSIQASAQILGGEIDYQCLGNNRFEVIAYLDQYCGDSIIQPTIKCRLGNQVLTADSMDWVSTETNSYNQGGCIELDTCGLSTDVRKIKHRGFRGVFDLSGDSTCETIFFVREALTQSHSWTLSSRSWFYISSEVNRCLAPCDASPIRISAAPHYLPHNQDALISFGVTSRHSAQDSISYEFFMARTDESSPATYTGNFSKIRWLTFFGFPNQNLQFPAGLHLYSLTGDILMRPTQVNQPAIGVIKIKIHRMINGVMTQVGTKYIEHHVRILSSPNNKAPRILPPYSKQICVGAKACLMIQVDDDDAADSIELSFQLANVPNATLTQLSGGKHPVYEVCMTSDSTHASNIPYTFTAQATDNACPLSGSSMRSFSIFVRDKPVVDYSVTISDTVCSKVQLTLQPRKTYAGFNYSFMLTDSLGKDTTYLAAPSDSLSMNSGKFYLNIQTSTSTPCYFSAFDSFIVKGSANPHYSIPNHFIEGCEGAIDTLKVIPGISGYEFTWGDGQKGSERIVRLNSDSTAFGIQIGNGMCTVIDSFWIYPTPVPDLSRFYEWKDKDSLRLSINNPMVGVKYSWYADFATTPLASGNFVVVDLADSINHHLRLLGENFRCRTEDTFTVLAANRTGFNEALQEGKYSIYPNPFSDYIHIDGPEQYELFLFDVTGKKLLSSKSEHGHFTLDELQEYPKGVYWLLLSTDTGIHVEKIVKK